MSTQSLVLQIPRQWEIAACYVPILGSFLSSYCHQRISNLITKELQSMTPAKQGNLIPVAKKEVGRIVELLDLRKDYLQADQTRNIISIGLAMIGIWIGLFGIGQKLISIGSALKPLLCLGTWMLINAPMEDAAKSRQREEAALSTMLQKRL